MTLVFGSLKSVSAIWCFLLLTMPALSQQEPASDHADAREFVFSVVGTPAQPTGGWNFITDYPGNQGGLYTGSVHVVANDTPYVMVFGGYHNSPAGSHSDVWAWNTITGVWSQRASLPSERYYHHIAVLNNNVFIISGSVLSSTTPIDTVYEYNPATNTYTLRQAIPVARNWGGTGTWNGASVSGIYVVGGSSSGTGTYINDVWFYEPTADNWYPCTNTGQVFTARRSAAVSVVNGPDSAFIVVAGGFGTAPTFKPDAYEALINPADPLTLNWRQIPNIPAEGAPGFTYAGQSRTAGASYGPYHLVIGGELSFTPADTTFRYSKQVHAWNTVTKSWSRLSDKNWGSSNMIQDAASPTGGLWQMGTYGTSTGSLAGASGTRVSEHLPAGGTSVDPVSQEIPETFSLSQNYPNPFNPSTTISFTIPVSEHVTLKVHNTLGQEIASLHDGELRAGTYEASWNAAGIASGVYFYRLQAGSYSAIRKLVLLK